MVGIGRFWNQKTASDLGLGQIVSLLITATGFATSQLSRKGFDVPTSQSFSTYVLLAIVYGSLVLYRRKPLQMKWYFYLFLALVDVEGNFLVVKAYQYTSLTSVMLLDSWTIPSVIFLTWMFLKTQYTYRKFLGVGICLAGLVTVIFSDVHASDRRESGSSPVKGDLLVICGSMLYAVSNVSQEFLVKAADRIEVMAMLGAFGAIVSACQIAILERAKLASIHWTSSVLLPIIGFVMATFTFYSCVSLLLKNSGSTMFNLSLLTSDMWAVLIRVFAYHEKVDWLYFIAFGAVSVGLVVYSVGGKDQGPEIANQVATDYIIDCHDRNEAARLVNNTINKSAPGVSRVGDGKTDHTINQLK